MTVNTLRGRTALVTGGFRGIGAAISRALAEAGAAVVSELVGMAAEQGGNLGLDRLRQQRSRAIA